MTQKKVTPVTTSPPERHLRTFQTIGAARSVVPTKATSNRFNLPDRSIAKRPSVSRSRPIRTGFFVWRPGRIAYRDALTFQEQLVSIRRKLTCDILVLLEHPPVITLGRKAGSKHLNWTDEQLTASEIDIVQTNRGGDITLHSPGQLVGYPIVDLNRYQRDLHWYLRSLEQVLMQTLSGYDIDGSAVNGRTGVWVGTRKIASLGIAVRHWVAWHGFALNVNNNLEYFRSIVPCGLTDVTMTSMQGEKGYPLDLDKVADRLIKQFAQVYNQPCLGTVWQPVPEIPGWAYSFDEDNTNS
jgi:lipoate-protein ligase B